VKCGEGNANSPELPLLLPLAYHHSHFLAAALDFTSFFTMAFLGLYPFITAGLFWIRYGIYYGVKHICPIENYSQVVLLRK